MSEPIGAPYVRLDERSRTALLAGRPVKLTRTQYRLLECLLREPTRIFRRAELVEAVIAGGAVVLDRSLDVHVAALRRKLALSGLIETVRGKGYRWQASYSQTGAKEDGKS